MTYNTKPRRPLTKVQRPAFIASHGGCCYYCQQPITDDQWDDEHVLARELGGSDDMENRRPIHRTPCHKIKTAQDRKLIAKGNRIRKKISGLDPVTRKHRPKPIPQPKNFKWAKRPMQTRAKP